MRLFKFTLMTLACLLSYFVHAQENDTNQTVPPPPAPAMLEIHERPILPEEEEEDEIYIIVQDMPRFPGCEDVTGYRDEKKKCSDKKMLEFIYKNIRYPAEARANKIEGMVIISFVIEKDGRITDPKIRRDLEGGCGEEAVRIVESMPKWTPGKQRNQPVRVQYTLPVKFKLKG